MEKHNLELQSDKITVCKHQLQRENKSTRACFSKKHKVLIKFSVIVLATCTIAIGIYLLVSAGSLSINRNHKEMSHTTVKEEDFGRSKTGDNVKRYTLSNSKCNIQVELITYGGSLKVIKVPDRNGKLCDVTLGFDTLEEYEGTGNPYFGAVVGRFANRIANASFTYDRVEYSLPANNGPNTLHGGPLGWGKLVWQSQLKGNSVMLSHTSPDGDQGFPGRVECEVTISITDEGELRLEYKATTDKTTPINLTVHPYFNLGGEGSGNIYDHEVTFHADRYIPVGEGLIPTGEIARVENTLFDLRKPTKIGERVNNITGGGYDHNFCINGPTGRRNTARFSHPGTGIVMDVYTDQPGVQFYTGNFVDVKNGKSGHIYGKHSGFALETQNYPDAPNQKSFPDPFLIPGSEYHHTVWYKFSTQ